MGKSLRLESNVEKWLILSKKWLVLSKKWLIFSETWLVFSEKWHVWESISLILRSKSGIWLKREWV